MNGIDLLVADHRVVDERFAAFAEAPAADIAGQIVDLLITHDDAEQSALYPLIDEVLGPDAAAQARREHSVVKKLLDRARQQEGAALVSTMTALQAAVTDHVRHEEVELFPRLAEAATATQLDWLAAHLEQTKQRVG